MEIKQYCLRTFDNKVYQVAQINDDQITLSGILDKDVKIHSLQEFTERFSLNHLEITVALATKLGEIISDNRFVRVEQDTQNHLIRDHIARVQEQDRNKPTLLKLQTIEYPNTVLCEKTIDIPNSLILKEQIIANFINYYTTVDSKRNLMLESLADYMEQDHVNELEFIDGRKANV